MRVLWVSAAVILLDQVAKATVLRLMYQGESIPVVGEWLRFTFTENPGMAFGITAGPREVMTVFSIVVTVLVLGYLYSVRSGYTPYLVGLALIFGGAVGNIIDRVFYAKLLGYGDFFAGKVVDFIHVDLWRGYLPDALPIVGGHYTALFPIWNVADMAIVIGVVGIMFFQRRFHRRAFEEDEAKATPPAPAEASALSAASGPAPSALPSRASAAKRPRANRAGDASGGSGPSPYAPSEAVRPSPDDRDRSGEA